MTSYFLLWILIAFFLFLQHTLVSAGWFSQDEQINSPIVLWWTPFTGEKGAWRTCGEDTCFFTENRTYLPDPKTKMVLFYGSGFSHLDLPLPSHPDRDWALLHEESPKNNPSFCYEPLISLFNYTATWSRFSNFPLTLLNLPRLDDITDRKYFVPVEKKNEYQTQSGLSPVVYVQSSCDAPSERDLYVKELQKFINVDSYGKCLNNKQLPKHLEDAAEAMNDDEFFRLMAQYKFTISFENAIGEDYITEKLWRPLTLGSVPVYLGSPSVQDWSPNAKSIISVRDFPSPESLAAHLLALNADDEAYGELLRHKTRGQVDNVELVKALNDRTWSAAQTPEDLAAENFVEAFECFLCAEVIRKSTDESRGFSSSRRAPADSGHFQCPPPVHPVTLKENPDNWWNQHWNQAKIEAQVVHQLVFHNRNYTADDFHREVIRQLSPVPLQ